MKRRSTYVRPPRPSGDAREWLGGLVLAVAALGMLYGGLALIALYGRLLGVS